MAQRIGYSTKPTTGKQEENCWSSGCVSGSSGTKQNFASHSQVAWWLLKLNSILRQKVSRWPNQLAGCQKLQIKQTSTCSVHISVETRTMRCLGPNTHLAPHLQGLRSPRFAQDLWGHPAVSQTHDLTKVSQNPLTLNHWSTIPSPLSCCFGLRLFALGLVLSPTKLHLTGHNHYRPLAAICCDPASPRKHLKEF